MRTISMDLTLFSADSDGFELAKSALRRLSNIAVDIAVHEKSPAAGEISALLFFIAQTTLDNNDPNFEIRFKMLLVDLERVCMWHQKPAAGVCRLSSILAGLAQPETCRLAQQAEATARTGITAFVNTAPHVVKMSDFEKLRHFVKRFGHSPGEHQKTIETPRPDINEYTDHTSEDQGVSRALRQTIPYRDHCSTNQSRILIQVRLER